MSTDALVLVAIPLLIAMLLHWLPLWRRHNLWFGVTVPPGFGETAGARHTLAWFRVSIWMISGMSIACLLAGIRWRLPPLLPIAMLGQTIGASVTFATVRRSVLPFADRPTGIRSAALTAAHEGLPGGIGAVLIPLGMLAATAAYLRANWRWLPARFPIHWGIDGTPNGWAARTWQGVFGPLIICALVTAFMLGMAELIIHASPRGRGTGTEAWTARFRRANLLLLVAGAWGVTAMICIIALLPLVSDGGRPTWMVAILPIILIGAMLPFVIQMIRLTRDPASGSDGTPDRCWKFGQIYYNPDDPAVLVEKRFGLGYTLNLGHRGLVWVLGVAMLVFVLIRVMIATA